MSDAESVVVETSRVFLTVLTFLAGLKVLPSFCNWIVSLAISLPLPPLEVFENNGMAPAVELFETAFEVVFFPDDWIDYPLLLMCWQVN